MSFLDELDEFVEEDDSVFDSVLYFFLERGVGYEDFCRLPIPYIISMITKHAKVMKEQEKALKRKK